MDFREFLTLARTWAASGTRAAWHSAISRGYYAAFHVGADLLRELGFAVPQADRAHAFVWLRLSNSGDPDVIAAGHLLNDLRRERNRADYDRRRSYSQQEAIDFVQFAADVIQALDAARAEPTRSQITAAMRTYERDVLRDVTWQPTP